MELLSQYLLRLTRYRLSSDQTQFTNRSRGPQGCWCCPRVARSPMPPWLTWATQSSTFLTSTGARKPFFKRYRNTVGIKVFFAAKSDRTKSYTRFGTTTDQDTFLGRSGTIWSLERPRRGCGGGTRAFRSTWRRSMSATNFTVETWLATRLTQVLGCSAETSTTLETRRPLTSLRCCLTWCVIQS